jgi:hypothetical protein
MNSSSPKFPLTDAPFIHLDTVVFSGNDCARLAYYLETHQPSFRAEASDFQQSMQLFSAICQRIPEELYANLSILHKYIHHRLHELSLSFVLIVHTHATCNRSLLICTLETWIHIHTQTHTHTHHTHTHTHTHTHARTTVLKLTCVCRPQLPITADQRKVISKCFKNFLIIIAYN